MRKSSLTILMMFVCSGLCANSFPCFENTFISGEFLWWQAQSERFNTLSRTVDTSVLPIGEVNDNERRYYFGFDPGVRIGLETEISVCDFKIAPYASFTHFRSTQNQTNNFAITQADLTYDFFPVSPAMDNNVNGFIDEIGETSAYTGSADFLYNRVDVGFAKVLYECERFSIIPKIAFTYLHTRQTILENMTLLQATVTSVNLGSSATHYTGYGLTLGFDSYYDVVCGFSFYGNLALSGVWGPWDTTFVFDANSNNQLTQSVRDSNTTNVGRWLADLQIGLQYQTNVCSMFEVAARLGWEFIYLPDQMNFNQRSELSSAYKMSGLVAGIGIGF